MSGTLRLPDISPDLPLDRKAATASLDIHVNGVAIGHAVEGDVRIGFFSGSPSLGS
jgi:hypothetical protein